MFHMNQNLKVVLAVEPDEVKANPELWEKIGEERSEQLDVVPTRFFKVVAIRPKCKKIADRSVAPVVAPAPKWLIENWTPAKWEAARESQTSSES